MELHKDYYNYTSHNDLPHIGKSSSPQTIQASKDKTLTLSVVDHCLDAIRQYIQCAGITTLIPTKWREGAQRNYIDSDQVHTCRSFTYLRDFATKRRWGGPDFVQRDRSLFDPRKHELAEKKMEQVAQHWPPS